jgi:hypothetical protein
MNVYEQSVSDTAWLLDELARLKSIILDVPYSERPMGQDSVLDMLSRIGQATDEFFLPVLENLARADAETDIHQWSVRDLNARYEKAQSPVDDPELLMDGLISSKKRILQMLKGLDSRLIQKKIVFRDGEDSVPELVARMNGFDRKQLKVIAERMLSMDFEKIHGK